VFIEHPKENSMASFSFTSSVLDEGTTFIFGSWICVANSSGGLNGNLADSRKPEASAASQCSDLDEFVDNLDKLFDEDISPLHTMQQPITRACARQLDSRYVLTLSIIV
jgi:hypothetical protein